ncbi:MAG: hypothetical protein U1E15_11170 [Hyphomicrobiales bacterium]
MLLIAAAALVFGFISLALFIAGNMVDTMILAVVLGIAHAYAHAVADEANTPERPLGHLLRAKSGLSEGATGRLQLIFRTFTDIVIAIVAPLSLGGPWAVSFVDFAAFLRQAADGIEIGNITIDPVAILWAFFVLALGVVLTRYVTSWLQRRVLQATRMDKVCRI